MTQPFQPEPTPPRAQARIEASRDRAEDQPRRDQPIEDQITEDQPEADRPIAPNRAMAYWLLTLFVIFSGSLVSLSWFGFKLFQTNAERINQVLANQQADQTALQQSLKAAQAQLAQTQSQIEAEHSALAQIRAQQHTSQQDVTQQIDQIEHKVAGIQDRLGRGETAWQMADIGFLLTRAQERLSLANDAAGASVALKLADEHIASLALPQMLPVRKAISDALTELSAQAAFDRVGFALRLQREAADIPAWPLIGDTTPAASEPKAATATQVDDSAPWYIRWPKAAWRPIADWFSQQFSLTRTDEPVKASARAVTDRETQLWLTAVREALLARDTPSLHSAIAQAQDWIKTHYASQAAAPSAALDSLSQLQTATQTRAIDLASVFSAWQAAQKASAPAAETGAAQSRVEGQP